MGRRCGEVKCLNPGVEMLFRVASVEVRTLRKHRVSSTWGRAMGTQLGDWVLEDTSLLGCFPDKGSPKAAYSTHSPASHLLLALKGYPSPPPTHLNKWMLTDLRQSLIVRCQAA